MTTLTRWKLACALFAGIAGYATVSAKHSPPANAQAVGVASPKGAGIPSHLRRPLRISAEAAGISREELVDRALSARALRDLVTITDKLGAVAMELPMREIGGQNPSWSELGAIKQHCRDDTEQKYHQHRDEPLEQRFEFREQCFQHVRQC